MAIVTCKNCSAQCSYMHAYNCEQLTYTIQKKSSDNLNPLIIQTVTTAQRMSIGGEGNQLRVCKVTSLHIRLSQHSLAARYKPIFISLHTLNFTPSPHDHRWSRIHDRVVTFPLLFLPTQDIPPSSLFSVCHCGLPTTWNETAKLWMFKSRQAELNIRQQLDYSSRLYSKSRSKSC